MTTQEIETLLREPHVMNVATVRSDGRPHVVAMWYGFAPDGRIGLVTYRRSQKVKNLRRTPFLTGLVECGERYAELRGVQLVADASISDEQNVVEALGRSVLERYNPIHLQSADADSTLRNWMAKRVAIVLDVRETASWDHSKRST